jgi:hypothetical protein
VIGAKIRARLQTATDARILATSPKFVLNIPRATAVPSADRQARRLTGITFDARMAGAILGIRLRGRVAA